jgi:branched-subunit amino acid transport protein AzlD
MQVAGGCIALAWLGLKKDVFVLFKLSPFIFAGILYALAAYVSNEPRDTYPYQAAMVLLFYGLPTGLCFRRLVAMGRGRAVSWALMSFAVVMSIVGLIILKNPEVQRITAEATGGFQRTNGSDTEVIVYLRYFSITNVIIGIVPFTLFALAAFPAALTERGMLLKIFICGTAIIAAYTNVQIATRTTLMAAALSSVLVMLLAFRSMSWRRLMGFGAFMLVLAGAGIAYVTHKSDRFYYLMDRFAAMGSDSRLGIWSEAFKILQRTPDGHGIRQLQSHEWAHNLFLDVGLTDGWIAIVAMALLYGGAFFLAWRCVRSANFFDSGANVIMLGWLMASFVASMILPPQLAFLATMHISLGFFAPYRVPASAANPDWPEMGQPARMAY